MGGGGNLVDGVRRWLFQRPSSSSSSTNHEPILNSSPFSNPDQFRNDRDSNELIIIEDLDFSGLTHLKVPKRNHLPMDPNKKVTFFSSSHKKFLLYWECIDDLIWIRLNAIWSKDLIFMRLLFEFRENLFCSLNALCSCLWFSKGYNVSFVFHLVDHIVLDESDLWPVS